MRSFRLRIAILSVALAGGALVGLAVVSGWLIYKTKINRLESQMVIPLVMMVRVDANFFREHLDAVLSQQWANEHDTRRVAWVLDSQATTLYQSRQWPSDLNVKAWLPSLPVMELPLPTDFLPPKDLALNQERNDPTTSLSLAEKQPQTRPVSLPLLSEEHFKTQTTQSGKWHVGAIVTPHRISVLATNLQGIHQEMAMIRNIFLIAIPGVLLVVAGGAWGISVHALRPIQQLTNTMQAVTVQGLEQRVSAQAIDVEFIELIAVFNQMLERLERSFKQASRFSADAAHELKTPLAILQGKLERTLQEVDIGSPIQQSLGDLLDEVCRLSELVRKLLLLSLADAGRLSLCTVEVELSEMVCQLAEDIDLLAPNLKLTTDIKPGLRVRGDRELLARVLLNLISNAIKYNLPNGWISIRAGQTDSKVWITISNASANVPDGDCDRIFDRFYRGDPAHTRRIEGTGLGLNLAWEISRSHGGELTLDSVPLGQTAFTLRLPASPIRL